MPAAQTVYRPGPDGLPAREVGPWVERKAHFVDRYAHLFATGMKNLWKHRIYVELFAGPGLSYDRARHEFIDGSAVRALDADFTDYVYVDLDSAATAALTARTGPKAGGRALGIIPGDCNLVVGDVLKKIPDGLTLAFIDPTNWQVSLQTVRRLAEHRRTDILMTFHAGSMLRVAGLNPPGLDAFFGTREWRDALVGPREERVTSLMQLYNRQLEPFGYQPDCFRQSVSVRNTKNAMMYTLVLFTKSSRGLDFWQKARAVDEGGQLPLQLG